MSYLNFELEPTVAVKHNDHDPKLISRLRFIFLNGARKVISVIAGGVVAKKFEISNLLKTSFLNVLEKLKMFYFLKIFLTNF